MTHAMASIALAAAHLDWAHLNGAYVLATPFLQPLKVWDYWPWLLLPLCFGVSVVYKSVRVESVSRIPLEAVKATFWIVAGMGAAAVALLMLVRFMAH